MKKDLSEYLERLFRNFSIGILIILSSALIIHYLGELFK